jgi:hypothetical protein
MTPLKFQRHKQVCAGYAVRDRSTPFASSAFRSGRLFLGGLLASIAVANSHDPFAIARSFTLVIKVFFSLMPSQSYHFHIQNQSGTSVGGGDSLLERLILGVGDRKGRSMN